MDRTAEFFSVVGVLKAHGACPSPSAPPDVGRVPPPSRLFRASAELSRSMKRVARLVARLRTLSKLRGLFNDPGPEINELCGALKGELAGLDAGLRALGESAAREAGAPPPGAASPRAHWQTVVDTLQGHVLALTRGFQDALRARATTLASAMTQRRAFAHSTWAPEALPAETPLFAAAGAAAPPPLPSAAAPAGGEGGAPAALRRRGAAGAAPPLPFGGAPLLPPPTLPTSLAYSSQTLSVMHDSRARAADARAVETSIVELGAMFTRMAALVGEQGDVLARIEADVEEAGGNVEAGQAELSKYYASVKRNRGFILRMFAALVFVILVVRAFR
jgi:syntaxin 5